MNPIPSINTFLDEIDTDKTIDREEAAKQIGFVVLLQSVDNIKSELPAEDQKSLQVLLENKEKFDVEAIYKLIEQAGKMERFLELTNQNIEVVRIDYIKTHLEALTSEKREQVLVKFPSLKDL